MLPRGKRIVLKASEVEEYRRKSKHGHWVLVEYPNQPSSADGGGGGGHASTANDRPDVAFTVDVVPVVPGPGESFLDISGRGFVHADGQNFAGVWDRVTVVNANDNRLRPASFNTFGSVWRLSLRRNSLRSVEPIDGCLARSLTCLDVSENQLSPNDVYRLSMITRLEQLYISANKLKFVPESITDLNCFLSLESLDLSDNYIASSKTFFVLSTLHNLRTLDLSTNLISFIPYLTTKEPCNTEQCRCGDDDVAQPSVYQHEEDVPCQDETNEPVYHVQHIPFASLQTINLTNNNIAHSSSVLPLICWPTLTDVTLTANTISLKKNLATFESLKSIMNEYDITIIR